MYGSDWKNLLQGWIQQSGLDADEGTGIQRQWPVSYTHLKNLLFIVGGILLVVLVIQFGFRNFLAENKEQKATKAALEAELKELDVIQKNEKEYTAQTEEWKKKTKEYYKEFPAMVKAVSYTHLKASVKILRLFSSGAGRGYSKQFTAQGVHRRKLYRRINAV